MTFLWSVPDIGINRRDSTRNIAELMANIARSLLANLGRNKDAGDCRWLLSSWTQTAKGEMLAFAGVTYAATRIFDRSEEAYVKALHITSRTNSLNLSDGLVECFFAGLFNTYVDWSCNAGDDASAGWAGLVSPNDCATLLARAGFPFNPDALGTVDYDLVQVNLKARKQARLALERARKCSDSQSFREACLLVASEIQTWRRLQMKEGKEKMKKGVKVMNTQEANCSNTQEKGNGRGEAARCSNPTWMATDGGPVDLQQSMCRRAYYCDRRCQKDDR
jgi:hypothetical protein